MEPLTNTFEKQEDNFQLKRFANLIIGNWYWVIGCLMIALGVAYLILRYESPVYVVNASFLTKKFDDQNSNPLMQLSEATNPYMSRIDVSQEIPLLKSQDRIQATLDQLDFEVTYYLEGNLKVSEVYPNDFYRVMLDSTSRTMPYGLDIYVRNEDSNQFTLQTEDPEWGNQFEGKVFKFGETNLINGWRFKILANKVDSQNGVNQHFFKINRPADLLTQYRAALMLNWQAKGSSILNAAMATELPEKEYDFLNAYFDVIVQKGLEEKSQSITSTIRFINEYIPQISDTLSVYQKRLDRFKLENRELINGSSFVMDKLEEFESQKVELIVTNKYYDYLKAYVRDQKRGGVFAPALMELNTPLAELMSEYMQIKWEDKIKLNKENELNPLVTRDNAQIIRVEQNIYESIENLKAVNTRQIGEINRKINFYYETVKDLQVESREYYELERMVSLYEGVFNNLITSRTEAFLSLASTVTDYQVVSNPSFNKNNPISPDKNKLMIIAVLIGLGFPLGVLYLVSISNDKVVSKYDLLTNTNIPLLGYVGHSEELDNLVVHNTPKSLVSESFRRIRANLQYFSNGDAKHVILVTSSISSEGKTFCSSNLAFTYALSGKKTIIIGADMRKPTLAKSFGRERDLGLSNCLAGQCKMDEVIYDTGNDNLKIIPGGSIPPNPAELILMPRMKEMMDQLKKDYDLIIIDTPPIGLVADAIELMEYSDLNILIVRQNTTFKKSLHETSEAYEKKQLKNMTVLFNDVDFQKLEYGYKAYVEGYQSYGYGYDSGYFEEEGGKGKKGSKKRMFGNDES